MIINLIKKYWMLLVALLAIFVAIIITLSESNGNNIKTVVKTPTSTFNQITLIPTVKDLASNIGFGPNPSGILEIIQQQEKELEQNHNDYPLVGKLPYKGANFTIDHYLKPRELVINIKVGVDKENIKQAVDKWLQSNNFEPNTHTIKWIEE
jgi:hypothetical protein